MTYEHGPQSSLALPDIVLGVPEVCDKCNRDCSEICEAFKRLISIANYLTKLQNSGNFVDRQKITNILEGKE